MPKTNCPRRVKLIASLALLYGLVKGFMLSNEEVYNNTLSLVDAAAAGGGLLQVPFSFQLGFSLVGTIVMAVTAILMWRGSRLGLYAFSAWMAASVLLTLLIAGPTGQLWAKLTVALLLMATLFSGRARQYFMAEYPSHITDAVFLHRKFTCRLGE